jgi:hypothetical protein
VTIEIRQLVIRAVVEPRRADVRPQAPAAPPAAEAAHVMPDRDDIIAECARVVLRELRKGRER